MADYFAVLNRTLSGFTDPKPQLREKLYERARSTIERQLQMRTPPPDAATLQAELQKLEEAIGDIERGYNPDYVNATVGAAAPEPEASQPESTPTPEAEPVPEQVPEPDPDPDPVPEVEQQADPVPEPAPELPPVEEQPLVQEPAIDPVAEFAAEPVVEPVNELVPEEEPNLLPDPQPEFPPISVYEEPDVPEPQVADVPALDPVVDASVEPVAADAAADPLDAWADEFLSNDPAAPAIEQPAPAVEQAYVAPATAAEPGSEIPSFDQYAAEELAIPPAAPIAPEKPKRSFGKWILLLLFLALLGVAGYFGWTNKDGLTEKFGLSQFLDDPNDPTRPKPVKTITITPEPEEPEAELQGETPAVPKSETRLTESGEEVTPEPSTPAVPLPPTVSETSEPAQPIERANAGDGPVVAQSAILYEEGSTRDQNSVDSGRVVWSVVQESTGNGEETAPAIRARVEIPDRSAVLIMTIKRNGDQALPASHLIELIFAVPDNFSGGAIDNINRYVLKENEQGQGEALVGVPARIADGIFLIALNNLDEAKQKNTSLLRDRDWIDIPMQYRTGRRALMTIEKGVPGQNVFKEVFDAWDKLDAS
jgi:hypothetical protein